MNTLTRNNSTNQPSNSELLGQKLPSQVAPEEITITSPFNSLAPSALSSDRIREINRLCLASHLRSGHATDNLDYHSFVVDYCGMEEVFETICEVDCMADFHRTVDRAFQVLIEKQPHDAGRTFDAYTSLSNMFRVLARHRDLINSEWYRIQSLMADFNTLDSEEMERQEGGSNNA